MKNLIFLLCLSFFTFNFSVTHAQHKKKGTTHTKSKAYNSADYPSNEYATKTDTASLGQVKIQLIHVMSIALSEDADCKSWMIVKKGNKSTAQLFYDGIQPDFGAAGIFKPTKQPREDLFLLMKFGDFDGRILIIDRDGNLNNMPGGNFYVSEDNDYLFSNYSSDQTGLTVINLGKNDLVYSDSADAKYKLGQWYFQDDKYFAIAENKDAEDSSQVTIGTLDMKKKKLIFSQVDKTYPDKNSKLKFFSFYTDPANKGDCTCGKR